MGQVTGTERNRSRRLDATMRKLVALRLAEEQPSTGKVSATDWGRRCLAALESGDAD